MTRHLHVSPQPEKPAPKLLIAVDRAIAELRRGAQVLVKGEGSQVLMLAAEAVADESLMALKTQAGSDPALAITGRRAGVLGLAQSESGVFRLVGPDHFDTKTIVFLADPCAASLGSPDLSRLKVQVAGELDQACVALAKLARLLPAAVVADTEAAPADVILVRAADIAAYRRDEAFILPDDIDYATLPGLSNEARQKLIASRPRTIGHAAKINGVTPAALTLLVAYVKRGRGKRPAPDATSPTCAR